MSGIHSETAGAGRDLLFLHAGVADSRMWRDQLELPGCRSIIFDQRGFGKTPWVPGPYADWEDAIGVMDRHGSEETVVVGCSLGGGIATHLALAAPERVEALVLIGAAARGWEPAEGWPDHPLWDEEDAAAESGDLERIIEVDMKIWLAGFGRTLDDISLDLQTLFLDMDRIPAGTEAARNKHVRPFDPPVNDRLDEITCPTLVMVGEYDAPELIESAGYLADRLSDQPAVVIPDAAHLPSLEQPGAFNRALSAFLATL